MYSFLRYSNVEKLFKSYESKLSFCEKCYLWNKIIYCLSVFSNYFTRVVVLLGYHNPISFYLSKVTLSRYFGYL